MLREYDTPNGTIADLQETIETQKKALQWERAKNKWIEDLDTVCELSLLHKKLLSYLTPHEIMQGQGTQIERRKLYLPAIAKKLGINAKTVTRGIQALEMLDLLQCERISATNEEGLEVSRVWLVGVSTMLIRPSTLELPHRNHGGVRVKRCTSCDSPNLIIESQVICPDCGATQGHKMIRLVNAKNDIIDELTGGQLVPLYQEYTQGGEPQKTKIETERIEPPDYLKSKRIWVCWRYVQEVGKANISKVPYVVSMSPKNKRKASVNNPQTWESYQNALHIYTRSKKWIHPYDGIGFMCDGSFTVFDYDHVIEQGVLNEQTHGLMQSLDTYAELSPSETGIHQIAQGTIPTGVHRDIEMYCTGRFMTFTGKHIINTPVDIMPRQEQVDALYDERVPKKAVVDLHISVPLPSDESILERARCAKNGEKFRRLYDEGDASEYPKADGSPDYSSADMALCAMLTYWTYGDEQAIDRLFRESALYRDKWDDMHGDMTYGQRTIKNACESRQEN